MAQVIARRGGYFSRRSAADAAATEEKPEFEVVNSDDFEKLTNAKLDYVYTTKYGLIVSYQRDLGINAWREIPSDTDDIPTMTFRMRLSGVPTDTKTGESAFSKMDPTMTYMVIGRTEGRPVMGRISRSHEDHMKGKEDVMTYSKPFVLVKAVASDGSEISGQKSVVELYEKSLKKDDDKKDKPKSK